MAKQRSLTLPQTALRPVKHPYTGAPSLVRNRTVDGFNFTVRRRAKYAGKDEYFVDEFFAAARAARDGNGVANFTYGYVVTRNDFGEIRHFPTLEEATHYVEALFALEVN